MKSISSALLVLTFLLGACTTESAVATETKEAVSLSTLATEISTPAREAVLSELENTVSVRKTNGEELAAAQAGMSIFEGGSVETGENSRVRIDLMPEGTVVRVGPNSAFSFPILDKENGEPKTTLQLVTGKIFILLNGGSLNVETPSGVASVRGSLLSVEYDPESKRISAACLEGDCGLRSEDGDEMELPEGEESFIEEGELPMDPFPMDRDEIEDWLEENPDLESYMQELPDPQDFPDLPDDFDGDMESISEEDSPTDTPDDNGDTPDPDENDSSNDDGGGDEPEPEPE